MESLAGERFAPRLKTLPRRSEVLAKRSKSKRTRSTRNCIQPTLKRAKYSSTKNLKGIRRRGAALEDVLRREANKRLAGIIVLSDGAQRALVPRDLAPYMPARRLADLGFPLYAVAFGQARGAGQSRDVALQDLLVNQTVFVKNELAVSATVRIDGFANQDIPLQLLFETRGGAMEVVATKPLRSESEGQSLPVALSHIPQLPGEYKVTLQAAKQPGELVTTNNYMSTFVTVLEGGLNVLYLEGKPRVEAAFLGAPSMPRPISVPSFTRSPSKIRPTASST